MFGINYVVDRRFKKRGFKKGGAKKNASEQNVVRGRVYVPKEEPKKEEPKKKKEKKSKVPEKVDFLSGTADAKKHVRGRTISSGRESVISLRCPNCGAKVTSDLEVCKYCNSPIKVVKK